MTTLEKFIPSGDPVLHQPVPVDDRLPLMPFHAGQPVWWTPPEESRPVVMIRTQSMLAGVVKSVNRENRTVAIEHHDAAMKAHTFLVPAIELARREIPR